MNAGSEQVMSNKEKSGSEAEKGRQIASKRYDVGKGTILELNDSELVSNTSSIGL